LSSSLLSMTMHVYHFKLLSALLFCSIVGYSLGMISRAVFVQSLPFLIATGLGESVAGLLFGGLDKAIEQAPGLIVMIPPLIGLRGNIGSALASRLGTATHLGLVSSREILNERAKTEVVTAIILSLILSLLIGVTAFITCGALDLAHMELWKFVFVAASTGFIDGTLLSLMTLGIVFLADRRGADPDNIASPALATIGDLTTLLVLFVIVTGTGVVV